MPAESVRGVQKRHNAPVHAGHDERGGNKDNPDRSRGRLPASDPHDRCALLVGRLVGRGLLGWQSFAQRGEQFAVGTDEVDGVIGVQSGIAAWVQLDQ